MSSLSVLPQARTPSPSWPLRARAELELRRRQGRVKPLWQPLPGPQQRAFDCPADELFYGGAAGGGKTDLLLGLALTAHRKSIIFRREFTQCREIIERSKEIVGTHGSFNENLHIWRGLPGGRLVEFGGVRTAGDERAYQGRPHDLLAFDEVSEFLESQYRFLLAWARTTETGQRVRVVATGNPPTTPEGEWVIRYWAPWLDDGHPNPAVPGELRWYAVVEGEDTEVESGAPFEHGGEEITPRSRTFIPARLADNPHLANTGYGVVLQNLPEPLRSQLLFGDFAATQADDPWQVIPTAWVELAMERWRANIEPPGPLAALGVDVARGGSDQTVIARRYGAWFAPLEKYPGRSTPDGPTVATLVMRALGNTGAAINLDIIGIGSSVYDTLISQDVLVNGVNFAEKTAAMDRSGKLALRNKRAEAYWRLREALDPDLGDGLALPPDRELKADLCTPRWKITPSGVQVESKEEIVSRLGRSPDCGDAVVLALMQDRAIDWGGIARPKSHKSRWIV